MNFYNAFTTSFMIQLAWFFKKKEGKTCVTNYKSKLLPKLRNLDCAILSNLSDRDMDVNSIRNLIISNSEVLSIEIYRLIYSELENTELRKYLGIHISHLSDLFFKKISSIFKVAVVIQYTARGSNKVMRDNRIENAVGVVIKYDDSNGYMCDYCIKDGALGDPTLVGEPYYFHVDIKDQPVENQAENTILAKMAEVIKNHKLYMSAKERIALAEELMLDERFINLRNELLITITCNHHGSYKIFECKAMHCYKCLKQEMQDNENFELKCKCDKPYSQKDREAALKIV